MKFTLIVSGSGGQGVMSIGMSLAGSAVEGGKHATFMPLYGPEQRGGSAKCTVIVSDDEVISPLPKQSDGLIVMNESSFKKFTPELRPGGVLVRNINRTTSALKRTDISVVDVPADDMAHELGSDKIANIILIGAMLGYSGMLDPDVFMKSLEHKFASKGQEVIELNRKALDAGLAAGRAARGE
ncbi:MAG: 2-oxoacid:acceptor oxidoreductase family protein [Oscillospiraceae bacterium]|nr:2-oxoacid:acceptor oxidoreductase family protein [Oscillospiraceae bacterium]